MRVGVRGLGLVGLRVARELAGSAEVSEVVLAGGSPERKKTIQDALGSKIVVKDKPLEAVDVVVLASPDEFHPAQAREALVAGSSVVSVAESPATVSDLLSISTSANLNDQRVVVGAGFSPGVSTVLAAHAMTLFDEVTELHVASFGAGGPACARRKASAAFEDASEWRDGAWTEFAARSGREIQWFADPIGAKECQRGGLSEPLLLHRLAPSAQRLSGRMNVEPRAEWQTFFRKALGRNSKPDNMGAVRVEVRGFIDGVAETVVYGSVDRPTVATAAMAATVVVKGLSVDGTSGVMGAAEVLPPLVAIRELARRGVKGAVFEGS